jgi:hypothetical protein
MSGDIVRLRRLNTFKPKTQAGFEPTVLCSRCGCNATEHRILFCLFWRSSAGLPDFSRQYLPNGHMYVWYQMSVKYTNLILTFIIINSYVVRHIILYSYKHIVLVFWQKYKFCCSTSDPRLHLGRQASKTQINTAISHSKPCCPIPEAVPACLIRWIFFKKSFCDRIETFGEPPENFSGYFPQLSDWV